MITARTGYPTSAFAESAPPNLLGTLGAKLVDDDGTVVIARTTAGVAAVATGATWDYSWTFTAPATPGFYRVVWDNGAVVFDELVKVTALSLGAGPTFATLDELAVRLGYADADEFSAVQTAQGTLLLELSSGLIREAGGQAPDWEPDPVPTILRAVCLDACRRVMTNPAGVRSESEALGVHQHSVTYPDGASDLYLTDRELRLVRAAAGATGRATTIPGTTVDLLVELRDTGAIAEFPQE